MFSELLSAKTSCCTFDNNMRSNGTLCIILFLFTNDTFKTFLASASPPRTSWANLDLASLEKEWEQGDSHEDLQTPDDELYAISERERQKAMEKITNLMKTSEKSGGDSNKATAKEFEKAALEAQHAGKGVMIFATLRNDVEPAALSTGTSSDSFPASSKSDGSRDKAATTKWDWNSISNLCQQWSTSLINALVDMTCYPIEPTASDANASILITSARSWHGDDIYKFLVEHEDPRSVLEEVKWNDRVTKLTGR